MKTISIRQTYETAIRNGRERRAFVIPTLTLLSLVLWTPPSRAGLALSISPISIIETSTAFTGSFQVNLANVTDTSNPAPSVSNFTIQLELNPSQGIQFTGISQNTVDSNNKGNYIFNNIGGAAELGNSYQFSTDTFPNSSFTASDSDFLGSTPTNGASPAVTLNQGDSFGLALITFSATSATAGTAFLNFLSSGTSIADTSGNTVNYDSSSGSIEVNIASVPEPGTITLLAMAASVGMIMDRRGRRRRIAGSRS